MAIVEREDLGNCAVLRLNRPEALNAITTQMLDELQAQLDAIESDDTRAVILTGTGRGFCPGTDLKEPPSDVEARIRHVHDLLLRMVSFPKIIVAAINGLALGGGLELALACTFRVAAKEASLGLPEIKIGLLPSYGGTVLLPRLVGAGPAQEMMLSGEPMDAEGALQMGLVNRVSASAGEVVQDAHDFVQAFCQHSLVPQRAIRRAILEGASMDLQQALAHEYEILKEVSASEDCIEGVMSFIEKRPPVWKDR